MLEEARMLSETPLTLGLQIAQSRSYLCTVGPKVGIIYVLGLLGLCPLDSIPHKPLPKGPSSHISDTQAPKYL